MTMRFISLLLAVTLGAAPAAAASRKRPAAPAPSATENPRERTARAHFTKAERAFTLGKFNAALTSYQLAYEAMPLPAFLFNIAQCHRNLRNHEQAVFFYERYLSLDENAPNRHAVLVLIADEKTKMPVKPPEATAAPAIATADEEAAVEKAVDLGARPPAAERTDLATTVVTLQPQKPSARWWIWGAVGAAVIGGVAAVYLVTRGGANPRSQLAPIDARR